MIEIECPYCSRRYKVKLAEEDTHRSDAENTIKRKWFHYCHDCQTYIELTAISHREDNDEPNF